MDCHRQSSPYEPKGQGFESLTPYQKPGTKVPGLLFFQNNRGKAIAFGFFPCYDKDSYTTDGFSGIDHGEYSGREPTVWA